MSLFSKNYTTRFIFPVLKVLALYDSVNEKRLPDKIGRQRILQRKDCRPLRLAESGTEEKTVTYKLLVVAGKFFLCCCSFVSL